MFSAHCSHAVWCAESRNSRLGSLGWLMPDQYTEKHVTCPFAGMYSATKVRVIDLRKSRQLLASN